MEKIDFAKLKSGTDVRGTALASENCRRIDLTDEAVGAIVRAFYYRLAAATGTIK